MQKVTGWLLFATSVLIAAALLFLAAQSYRNAQGPELSTPYHAVLLTNGQVFYGRIENVASQYPVLREIYYIQSQAHPETKEVTNILVKRGREWHGPDRMMLNRDHVLLIEPVKTDSQVARLIEEQAGKR